MIKQNNILRFHNLAQFPNIIHGFSTRFFGNMRYSDAEYKESIQKFSTVLPFPVAQLVRMEEKHTNIVYIASENDRGQVISQTDGLITQDRNIFLGVITADCLPLLFYNPKTTQVAAVHAGWRGLYSEIIKGTVSDLQKNGTNPKDLIIGIGPSIRVCCYDVTEDFVEKFSEKFGDVEKFVERRDGKIFFNLQKFAKEQLFACGVLESNIEDGDYCTFTHDDVYSCRKEGKDFDEMMGVIGISYE